MEKMDNNIQKHADRGWQLMSQKLDIAMPQARKKRGLGWLWPWAAACLILVGAGFCFLEKNGVPADFIKAEKSAGLVVQKFNQHSDGTSQVAENQVVELNDFGSVAEVNDDFSDKKYSTEGVSGSEISSQNFTKHGSTKTGFQSRKSVKIGETKAMKYAPMPCLNNEDVITEKEIIWNREAQYLSDVLENKDAEKVYLKKIQLFDQLPGRDFSPIIFDKRTPQQVKNPIKPVAQRLPKKWQLGISAGLQTIDFQRLNGHSAGFAATRNLSKKMNLQAGLNWTRTILAEQPVSERNLMVLVEHADYLSQTNDYALEFTDPSKSVIEFFPPTGTGFPGSNYSNVQLAVSANVLHRLEMPLILTQKIGSRWHFGVGFAPSWQFLARSVVSAGVLKTNKSGKFQDVASSTNVTPVTDQISTSRQVNQILTRKLPQFDVAAVGFAGCDLSRNWQVSAQFQQGLLNQTALPSFQKQLYSTRLSITRWF